MIYEENKRQLNVGFKDYINKFCLYKDFPKKGVNFIDIFPLIHRDCFLDVKKILTIKEPVVVIPESRGFLFAGILGINKFVPIRKAGKLPGDLTRWDSVKEYGSDVMELSLNHLKPFTYNWMFREEPIPVCFFDDVLATGGTALSAIEAINSLEVDGFRFKVTTVACYIEILDLGARSRIDIPVESVYEY